MELQVFRVRFYETRTIGQLYINSEFFCFTLEDKVREIEGQPVEKWKVQDETAIPSGKYTLTLEKSRKYGTDTPTISPVPGFTHIRIHSGNTEQHTEGCLILGYRLNSDGTIRFGTTRPAVADLKKILRRAIQSGEKITIEIRNIK